VLRWDLDERLQPIPPNVNDATMQLGVVPDVGKLDLTVDARVVWADPRPPRTFVPSGDRVVIVKTVLEETRPRVIRSVVIADTSRVATIVREFNALPVSVDGVRGCSPLPGTPVSYRLAFATSRAALPDRVASLSTSCGIHMGIRGVYLDDPNLVMYPALEPELRTPVS